MKKDRSVNFKFYPAILIFCCMIITSGYTSASTVDIINAAVKKAGAKWVAGDTPLAYMSAKEKKLHLGLLRHPSQPARMLDLPADLQQAAGRLPVRFDWRDTDGGNYVTPVKDQSYCGSCWTFAGTAALESAVLIAAQQPGTPLDLAEQVLVSCMGVDGCSGGYNEDTQTFFSTTGLAKESCYPYLAIDGACTPCDTWQEDTFRVERWSWVTYYQSFRDINVIKYALYHYGPLPVSFYVYEDFDYYTSGVYSHVWGENVGGHAVLIVGWDDAAQALIVKNSWGTSWGEDGFFRIAYSELNGDTAFGEDTLAIEQVILPDACLLTALMPREKYAEGSGGSSEVQVAAPDSCPWTATTADSWITITGGASGSGRGTVTYSVAPKPDKGIRTGAIAVGGETFTITQGKWVTQTVDATGGTGAYTSLACDKSGTVHIAYYDTTLGALKYATNASGSWVSQTVDASGNGGTYISLAVDGSGRAHISYYNTSDLKYATNASGSWQTAIVDYAGEVGMYGSLALDGQSRAYISYYDLLNTGGGRLKLATNKSGAWETRVVDNASDVGQYSSLGLDSRGACHISYFDADNGVLKYATNASGSWIAGFVDNESMAGMDTSLAVDGNDAVHISYFAELGEYAGALKYATNASGAWTVETVDDRGMSGMYSSLAVDSSGSAHISYYFVQNRDLKYATNASGAWETQAIDSSLDVGGYSSIALDAGGNVHISYRDSKNYVLKYATDKGGTASVFTLYVKMLGTGWGTVASTPEGMLCNGDCKGAFANGTQVTLRAVPDKSIFIGWSGDCSDTGPCTVTMDESKKVSATFEAPCPAVQLMSENKAGLTVLRQLRDRVLAKTAEGKNYVKAYYTYGPELAGILSGSPSLRQQTLELLQKIVPLAAGLARGDKAALSPEITQEARSLCDAISAKAGPGLVKILKQLKSDIESGMLFKTK